MRWICSLIGAGLFALVSHAGDDLLGRVPRETAVCLVVRDLARHTQELSESAFLKELVDSPLGENLKKQNESKVLIALDQQLTAMLGVSGKEMLNDLFGEEIIFAFIPGPTRDSDVSLLMLRVQKKATAETLLKKLDEFQKATGEITEVAEHTHAGKTYRERRREGRPSEFYHLGDDCFLYSGDEKTLKATLEHKPGQPELHTKFVKAIEQRKTKNVLATLLIDAQRVTKDVRRSAEAADGDDARAMATALAKLWESLDTVVIDLQHDECLTLGLSIHYDPKRVPEVCRPFVTRNGSKRKLTSPNNPFCSLSLHAEPKQVLALVESVLSDAARKKLHQFLDNELAPIVGKTKLAGLLDGIGPEFSLHLSSGDNRQPLPAVTLQALLSPERVDDFELEKQVDRTSELIFQLIRVQREKQSKRCEIEEAQIGGTTIRSLVGDGFPEGIRPSAAVRNQRLVIASTREGVEEICKKEIKESPRPVFRLACGPFRDYLKAQGNALVSWNLKRSEKSREELEKELQDLIHFLALWDSVELRAEPTEGVASWSLQLKAVKPMK